ncbi:urea ABC transporter permease subunit UrtC [Arthrospira platensis]|jgi:urea transport system permease protein|uniref:Urea ABC transporter permease protein n=1 Tax=Limnospira platensis NIES-46 TaxID=1236695 RepID=A0A5M3T991_LIMPL|nr:urea ABC transporter permease subunit UrtC [Arthrospira platensis]AMW31111.1 urea ABC transporter permease subunit UrtC [Arthrospira platensis YZ]MBD2669135.1 urea ABC transporter permease subunit UrtC [Arthrospira platensis FACHB-439]MBD2711070.1 urea ABC transporter permease subunit UrtC [Arthrospira platensis FACHB-835]MDF2208518.1 urea ABC transporter permease subunit UrtC [Arthrospira platensis NCB002]MDT9183494.1 urea ABC transporter permease subunit UrtC [Limnospira sp. PMC 289.06]M
MNQEIGRIAQQKQKQQQRLIEIVVIIAIAIILGVIMPLALPVFRLKLLGRFLSLCIVALGIDLIWGYTGLLSLGHGIFFSLGGYALAMYLQLQLPEGQIPDFFMLYGVENLPWFWEPFYSFPFTLVAIFLIPGIVAAILGYLVFRNRIKGVYFSILTQAALLVFFHLFNGQQKYINGTNGLKTDTTMIFGTQAGSPAAQLVFYELSILLMILIYLLCRWLTSGRFGRLLVAIRDDENRVRFSGYDPTGFKVLVFAISGAIAGISGALYTVQSGIITPSFMEVAFSIEMVIWVAVGGRATLVGAILGTVLVRLGQTFLSEQFPQVWLFFQGALFLIVVTVLPSGIVGWLRTDGWEYMRSLLGLRQPIMTYPQLEEDPELQLEREELES